MDPVVRNYLLLKKSTREWTFEIPARVVQGLAVFWKSFSVTAAYYEYKTVSQCRFASDTNSSRHNFIVKREVLRADACRVLSMHCLV